MPDWTPYGFKDIPFLAVPAIKINSKDIRTNGELYYSQFALKEIEKMIYMIELEAFPWIFLQTEAGVLGNGKSAFLAHIYRNLERKKKNVLCAFARDDPRLTNLLSEILDAFVTGGKLKIVKKTIGSISPQAIEQQLKKSSFNYGYKTIQALNEILNIEDEKLVYKFSIIKRSNPNLNHGELFGGLLHLAYACGESRFTVFIDQFEEYVMAHNSASQRIKLGNEINDLLREIGETTTFVVSTHPKVTNQLLASSPEADTFTKIDESSSVRLPLMTGQDLLQMTLIYLKEFRVPSFSGDSFDPFQKDIILYAAERTELNPRSFILALRSALLHGAVDNFAPINESFITKNHSKIFGGLENKWYEFKAGKWKHGIS